MPLIEIFAKLTKCCRFFEQGMKYSFPILCNRNHIHIKPVQDIKLAEVLRLMYDHCFLNEAVLLYKEREVLCLRSLPLDGFVHQNFL